MVYTVWSKIMPPEKAEIVVLINGAEGKLVYAYLFYYAVYVLIYSLCFLNRNIFSNCNYFLQKNTMRIKKHFQGK